MEKSEYDLYMKNWWMNTCVQSNPFKMMEDINYINLVERGKLDESVLELIMENFQGGIYETLLLSGIYQEEAKILFENTKEPSYVWTSDRIKNMWLIWYLTGRLDKELPGSSGKLE